jgi:putative aminopeptidase FrvX
MKRKPLIALLGIGLLYGLPVLNAQTPDSGWDILRRIVLVPGISGQENKVIDWIESRLPRTVHPRRDAENDLWFTVGQGSPHILFVAHADELGMTVERISERGTVILKGKGGFLPFACEARPFIIHAGGTRVEGILIPRDDRNDPDARPFNPPAYELYVGADSEKEAHALGIAEGQMVIFKKRIIDLAPGIMATRAVDDRAGCAALLAAVLETDWMKVHDRTVTCAWSVEEETGLKGATALSEILNPDYVFAVDTFVSSDAPLENRRFADAGIGQGAVLRVCDSSNLTPKTEIRKIADLARSHGIPFQIRNSRGGNDGSVFVPGGAVDIPLSWPGVHAHSFIEKIDRRDLESLIRMIRILIKEWN